MILSASASTPSPSWPSTSMDTTIPHLTNPCPAGPTRAVQQPGPSQPFLAPAILIHMIFVMDKSWLQQQKNTRRVNVFVNKACDVSPRCILTTTFRSYSQSEPPSWSIQYYFYAITLKVSHHSPFNTTFTPYSLSHRGSFNTTLTYSQCLPPWSS